MKNKPRAAEAAHKPKERKYLKMAFELDKIIENLQYIPSKDLDLLMKEVSNERNYRFKERRKEALNKIIKDLENLDELCEDETIPIKMGTYSYLGLAQILEKERDLM